MSEDCLHLNVYVPKEANKVPVVVFISGEGFDFADAAQFDGSYLAAESKVMVVTIQYRVGVFGFLKLPGLSSGNMGLHDQIMALRWIQQNANSFGADPTRVTIFGRFTGSMSASILMTSPLLRAGNNSTPLFNRAILSSGIAVKNWVFEKNPTQVSRTFMNQVGCNTVDCLKSKSSADLLKSASYGWRPIIDHDLVSEEPMESLQNGHIAFGLNEVMLGTNEVDGSICLLTHQASNPKIYKKIVSGTLSKSDLQPLIKSDLDLYTGSSDQSLIKDAIHRMAKSSKSSLREKYLEFCSDFLIHSHVKKFSELLKRIPSVKIFNYQFRHRAPSSKTPSFITSAGHGDDIVFALGLTKKMTNVSKSDLSITTKFMDHLKNFFKSGVPDLGNFWTQDMVQLIAPATFEPSDSTVQNGTSDSCQFNLKSSSVVSFFTTHDYSSWQLVNSLSL